MSKLLTLSQVTVKTKLGGHCGIFTTQDLALLLEEPVSANFRKFLSKAVQSGVLKRVTHNLYMNPVVPPNSPGVLEKIARLLHWNKFMYVSLESQLSYTGRISQLTMQYLTLMTTGRKGAFTTPFGTVEFTHTQREISQLEDDVYFDAETGVFRAKEHRAIADLKRVGRNVHMLDGD